MRGRAVNREVTKCDWRNWQFRLQTVTAGNYVAKERIKTELDLLDLLPCLFYHPAACLLSQS
jgi:hypothetical protein